MHVLLIIPCFNEAESIGQLLVNIKSLDEKYEAIVIDDGSSDDTFKVASQIFPCIKLAANLGIGGAVQTGIKYAKENGYDICIQVDGDGQHPPGEITKLVQRYLVGDANIIIGSRFLGEGEFRSSTVRRIGIRMISAVLALLYQQKITDPTSGLRLLDEAAIGLFAVEYPHDFPEPVSLAMALENGLRVKEVPVVMKSREHGFSSIMGIKTVSYMVRVIGYLLLMRMRRHI